MSHALTIAAGIRLNFISMRKCNADKDEVSRQAKDQLIRYPETTGTRGWDTTKEIDFIKSLMYIGHPNSEVPRTGA